MATFKKRRENRGSALLVIILFCSVFACGAGWYFYSISHSASVEASGRENQATAQAYSEFAVELAMANLTDVEYKLGDDGIRESVEKDWVARAPYGTGAQAYERRITGTVGGDSGYEYVVKVVPVREAKEAKVVPDSWLSGVDVPSYDYGKDPLYTFSAAYEVTALARSMQARDNPLFAGEGSVRTVVSLGFQGAGRALAKLATLTVNPAAGLIYQGIKVAGEDHYSIKTVAKSGVLEDVIEGFTGIKSMASELFSMNNSYWNYGKQTVHYMKGDTPNPQVPRTIYFYNYNNRRNDLDLEMIRYDDDREPDQYITGGKYDPQSDFRMDKLYNGSGWQLLYRWGRGITLNEDNKINERDRTEATPDKKLSKETIAVGNPEDFNNLYFNFINPANNTSWIPDSTTAGSSSMTDWKNNKWEQVFFSNHPRKATRYTNSAMPNWIRPLDNYRTPMRRRFPIMLMVSNEDGALLVREYDDPNYSSPTRSNSAQPPAKWSGTYTWMYKLGYTNGSYDGYNAGNAMHYRGVWLKPTPTNTTNGPRNYPKVMNPRMFTLQEFMGVQMRTDANGIPAKYDGADIVAGIPDIVRDGDGKAIPYNPLGNGSQFDETYQRQNSVDNWGIVADSFNDAPPTDGIYVRLPDDATEWDWSKGTGVNMKKYQRCQTLKELSRKRDISNTAEPDIRDVTGVYMSFDTDTEDNQDYFYFNNEMTAAIVWPKRSEVQADDDSIKDIFKQWWQGQAEEGLTGGVPHTALGAWSTPEISALPGEERLQAIFETLGIYDSSEPSKIFSGVYTMLDESGKPVGFNRADFDAETGELKNKDKIKGKDVFYSDDDLWQMAVLMYESHNLSDDFTPAERAQLDAFLDPLDLDAYNALWGELIKKYALPRLATINAGYDLHHIDTRFSFLDCSKFQLAKELADGTPLPNLNKLMKHEGRYDSRSMSGLIFGERKTKLQAAYTKVMPDGTLQRLYQSDFGLAGSDIMAPVPAAVSFIPGEINTLEGLPGVVAAANDDGAGIRPWVKMMAKENGALQFNGQTLRPKFIWLEDPPLQEPEIGSGSQESMATIHDVPLWFLSLGGGSYYEDMLARYNREHRGALGWHREGPGGMPGEALTGDSLTQHVLTYGDHYEYVIMTAWEHPTALEPFNPYRTIDDGGNKLLAMISPEYDGGDFKQDTFVPVLRPSSEMRTFVIDGDELDGAGVLVVNGNLHIKTRFAYHGVLLVAGDIMVEPTLYEMYDSLHNRLNAEGKPIKRAPNGSWYLIAAQPGNSQGEWLRDNEDNLIEGGDPANEWRGDLIVQGKVLTGGKIEVGLATDSVTNEIIEGNIDIRSSTRTIEEVMGLWSKVGPNEKFQAGRLGWSTGGSLSGYDLWND